MNCYAKSLEILSIAKDNLNSENLQMIYELEQQVWQDIGVEGRISYYVEAIREGSNRPRGYYIYASFLMRKAPGRQSGQ